MDGPLYHARDYLAKRYGRLFESTDWQFCEELHVRQPCWIWQSEELRDIDQDYSAAGALVLDPQIGVCLFLVDFKRQPNVREAVSRALAVRQQLMPVQRAPDIKIDEDGGWRVVVNWLVCEEDRQNWINQIADLRERTAHFEEVSADVILEGDKGWGHALKAHGIPRLLVEVRTILAKGKFEEVEQWQSADEPVRRALHELPRQLKDTLAAQCAEELVKFSEVTFEPKLDDRIDVAELFKIKIDNFRNIEATEIEFRTRQTCVSSTIIHGPNGSGKSSIFESICFALSGSSFRYANYLEDQNRKILEREDSYIQSYLSNRLNGGATQPRLLLNEKNEVEIRPAEPEAARKMADSLKANMFSQECSRSLVSMSAAELGADIAGAFSQIASRATTYVDTAFDNAQRHQQRFNNDWDLRANVTKRETVVEQVAKRALSQHASFAEGVLPWLRVPAGPAFEIGMSMHRLADRLSAWRQNVSQVASRVSKVFVRDEIIRQIEQYFQDGNDVVHQVRKLIAEAVARVDQWPSDLEKQIELLGSWFEARSGTVKDSSDELNRAKENQSKLSETLDGHRRQGELLRLQRESLQTVANALPVWSLDHDELCITCSSDLSHRGGLSRIVSSMVEQVDRQLVAARREYIDVRTQLDASLKLLSELGDAEPPIPFDNHVELSGFVQWLLPPGLIFEDALAGQDSRRQLIAAISHFRRVSNVGPVLDSVHEIAVEVTDLIERVVTEHNRVAALPAAWKSVRDALNDNLAQVTAQHLPATTQGVWKELIQNMLPAPWQYPGSLGIKIGNAQAARRAAIVLQKPSTSDALAAHILNGAEVHNIGLAWFLTKYLTEGRFNLHALVMDDPAHSMDQPTFRDFCRLLETFVRLHKRLHVPLSLVVLLHQDSRAVDAARATGGILHLLRWNNHSPVSVKKLKLHDESVVAPAPFRELRTV